MARVEVAIAAGKAKGMSEVDAIKAATKKPVGDGLIDMKRSKKEAKKSSEAMCVGPSDSYDSYPYVLELRLDDETMKKLGLDLPVVGGMMTITAKVKVESAESRDTTEGGPKLSCRLQITKMRVA